MNKQINERTNKWINKEINKKKWKKKTKRLISMMNNTNVENIFAIYHRNKWKIMQKKLIWYANLKFFLSN